MSGKGLRPAIVALVALGAGFLVLALGLAVAGYDPLLSMGALWRGAFGSWYAIGSGTLVRAVPLIILGLGVAVAFRAGAFNIGAEGQFYAGAIAATWVGLQVGAWPGPLAVGAVWAAGAAAGLAWVAVPVLLKVKWGVLEVISTLLLNFVAEALVSFAVTGPLQETQRVYPQSDPIADSARLPILRQAQPCNAVASFRSCCGRLIRRRRRTPMHRAPACGGLERTQTTIRMKRLEWTEAEAAHINGRRMSL